MGKVSIVVFFVVFICSCTGHSKQDGFMLSFSDKYLYFQIDQETKLPQRSVFLVENGSNHYLTFQNNNEILIYDISSTDILRKITIENEGDNAIPGGFLGYNMLDMDNTFISSLYMPKLFLIDSIGNIKQKIEYSKADDSQFIIPCYFKSGMQMYSVNDVFYMPQLINPMYQQKMLEKSPVCISLDTINASVKILPMRFPSLITISDIGTSGGVNLQHKVYQFV